MTTWVWIIIDSCNDLLPKKCWFLIIEIPWHSPDRNFTAGAQATILYNKFENDVFKTTATFSRVNALNLVV